MDSVLEAKVKSLKAVAVFCGDITPAETRDHLNGIGGRSLVGVEGDKTGGCPSYERIQAAAVLYQLNSSLKLIVSGGVSNVDRGAKSPTIAAVSAAELQELGVPKEAIIEEPHAFSNWEQIVRCAKIIREMRLKAEEVGILQLFFVHSRVAPMIALGQKEKVEPFALDRTAFLSAERVLASVDADKWNAYFTALYRRWEMTSTILGDAFGGGQLWSGHNPYYPHPFRGFDDPLKVSS